MAGPPEEQASFAMDTPGQDEIDSCEDSAKRDTNELEFAVTESVCVENDEYTDEQGNGKCKDDIPPALVSLELLLEFFNVMLVQRGVMRYSWKSS